MKVKKAPGVPQITTTFTENEIEFKLEEVKFPRLDGITAEGEVTVQTPEVEFRILIDWFTLKELKFITTVAHKEVIKFKYDKAKAEIKPNDTKMILGEIMFPIPVPPPLIVTGGIQAVAMYGVELGIEGSAVFSSTSTVKLGVIYSNGQFTPVHEETTLFGIEPPIQVSLKGDAKGF